jgi:hypothetical protein
MEDIDRRSVLTFGLAIVATLPVLFTRTPASAQGFAQSVEDARAPVANYGAIWDGRISYSDPPQDNAQWEWLRAQGVKTIVTLDHQRINVGKFGFEDFLWIPLANGDAPTNSEARSFLRFVQDPDNKPAHILSADGNDRIATMHGLLRYAVDGQTMEAALAEAPFYNDGEELFPLQVEWLYAWAAEHQPGSHRWAAEHQPGSHRRR